MVLEVCFATVTYLTHVTERKKHRGAVRVGPMQQQCWRCVGGVSHINRGATAQLFNGNEGPPLLHPAHHPPRAQGGRGVKERDLGGEQERSRAWKRLGVREVGGMEEVRRGWECESVRPTPRGAYPGFGGVTTDDSGDQYAGSASSADNDKLARCLASPT